MILLKKLLIKIYYWTPINLLLKYLFIFTGKIPWSIGYLAYRDSTVTKLLSDNKLFQKEQLPQDTANCDERVVEYPWIIDNVNPSHNNILDAGSILNYSHILKHKIFKNKHIVIANLNPELNNFNKIGISYLYGNFGDLRNFPIIDNTFDLIICGSVIEHIGMDNQKVYSNKEIYKQNNHSDFLDAIKEFSRVLKSGGMCLITVPYGIHQELSWMQQFDQKMIESILNIFSKSSVEIYKYTDKGWKKSNYKEASSSSYFDINQSKLAPIKGQAAAGAVALIKLYK